MTPLWPRILLRALILCSAYLAFILSIAAMPMANTIAIYFTMPFFVAGLAGPFFGERVPLYRWIAITAGFAGVIVMVRPGVQVFEPASLLALYSAFGYAVGQMMGRKLAQQVAPLVIANWQNAIYLHLFGAVGLIAQATGFAGEGHKSLAFLTRPWVWPTLPDFLMLSFLGVLAAFTIVSFVSAYKFAESSFVAPFEYSAMTWAILFGLLFFNDFPDVLTWTGMAIVVGAGLFMLAMDRRAQDSHGIAGPGLHGAKRQRGLNALDAGKPRNARAVDAFVVGRIAGHHTQEIVELAAHQVAFENLRHALDRLLEFLEGLFGLRGKRHFHEELIGEPQRRTVKCCGIAGDDARLFQKLHAAVTG